jgi:hypothetical protein
MNDLEKINIFFVFLSLRRQFSFGQSVARQQHLNRTEKSPDYKPTSP